MGRVQRVPDSVRNRLRGHAYHIPGMQGARGSCTWRLSRPVILRVKEDESKENFSDVAAA
jgi:hypothetical protein